MSVPDAPTMTLPDDAVEGLLGDADPLGGVGAAPYLALGDPLGEGGMGAVVQGDDRALERPVAAKMLRADLRDRDTLVRRFVHEARLTASLEHPNIIPVHALAWRPDTGPFFTMKLAEGQTLLSRLRRMEAAPTGDALDEIVGMLVKLCDALELAHANGVAHCDLKADNILLGRYGEVYLTDWGVARRFPAAPPRRADGSKAISGTPPIMAPEQARGEAVDGRTDVFGMGTLLYHVLSRRLPFQTGSPQASVNRARRGARSPIDVAAPASPLPLQRVVERAMAHLPAHRYPTIGHLRDDLDRFRRGRLDAPVKHAAKGTALIREGDPSDCMYIVQSGRFVVIKAGLLRDETVREVGPGAVLGEVGLLAGGRRTATVRALTDGEVQTITAQHLEEALQRIPPWLRTVIETTGARFHERS